MVFKGTTGVYDRIYCLEKYANSKWILRNLFCCCSNLLKAGLRMDMDFRGLV